MVLLVEVVEAEEAGVVEEAEEAVVEAEEEEQDVEEEGEEDTDKHISFSNVMFETCKLLYMN